MSDYILNFLPLKGDEAAAFEALAPQAAHHYVRRSTVTEEQLQQATIILGSPLASSLADAPNVKWLHSMWAGVDPYLTCGHLRADTVLTSSAGFNSRSVAEHMLAMLLSLYRKLPIYRDNQRECIWKHKGELRSPMNSTILILGTGHIGQYFARFCRMMGARTIGFRRSVGTAVDGFDEVHAIAELDDYLPQADVLALALPHTAETAGLLNAQRFARINDGAVLINAGRGTVLDQNALLTALQTGKLWGAAIDVTDPEPLPADDPLWGMQNLIITPHMAGDMELESNREASIQIALDNLKRYYAGEPLKNQVQH